MVAEFGIGLTLGRNVYRLNDAIGSLTAGILSQVSGVFMLALSIGVYVIVYKYFALFSLRADDWRVWVGALVAYDFFYYWNHRIDHEVGILLGGSRRPPPERSLQSFDGVEAAEFGRAARLDLLSADGDCERASGRVCRSGPDRSPLPVLDSHRAGRQARLVRPRIRLAVEPPGASRRQRPVSRQELRRHSHRLGSPVRHLRG